MRLHHDRSLLLVVDIQARLAPAIPTYAHVIAHTNALIRVAGMLGIPVLATEHCPDRIGSLVPELRSLIPASNLMRKVHFCCTDDVAIRERLVAMGRTQVLVVGMEAHVCVLQATLGLQECGFIPFFVRNATGSRHAEDHTAALDRLRSVGVHIVTSEMAIFEWLERADAAAFKGALNIIKAL